MFIKVEDLNYTYMKGTPFERKALSNINLEIKEGEFIALIGSTGSGKTTLIQHFNRLLCPSSGKVYAFGQDLFNPKVDLRRLRQQIGLVFQFPESQLFEETVYDDIAFALRCADIDEKEVLSRVSEYLPWIGLTLDEAKKRSPFSISGGQMRKVALAGVMVMNPRVLVLDEPTVGLDPQSSHKILTQIKSWHKMRNTTVILVSHSMKDVLSLADKVVVMHDGTIQFSGKISNVVEKADLLKEIGLDLPDYTKLALELRKKGINIRADIFNIEDCLEEILKHWN